MASHDPAASLSQDLPENLEAMLEALIFVSIEPISVDRMVEVILSMNMKVDHHDVKRAIKSLQAKWNDQARAFGRGITLQEIAHGYAFSTAQEYASVAKSVVLEKPLMITKAQIEVLSIVAYRQPITRVDIDEIRGVDSSAALKRLMQVKLLKILGKSEGLGRPLLYGTTKRFLEFFSLNSLNDLPTLKQIESLNADEKPEINPEDERVSLKDLFEQNRQTPLFSEDVERLSDEALKSLDEAMFTIDSVEKIISE